MKEQPKTLLDSVLTVPVGVVFMMLMIWAAAVIGLVVMAVMV